MKRNITKIFAALALLVFMMPGLAVWGQTYNRISSLSDLTSGDYVIAAYDGTNYYALSNTFATQISGTQIAVTNGTISSTDAEGYVVTITKDGNRISISNGTSFLNCKSSGTSFEVGTTGYLHDVTLQTTNGGGFLIKHQTATRGVIYRKGTTNKFGNYSTGNVNGTEYYYVQLFKYTSGGGGSDLISTTTTVNEPNPQNFNNDLYVGTDAGTLTASVTYDNNGTTTNVPNATVTWASTDQTVATVDRQTGAVTLVAVGTTNITATYEGDQSHAGSVGTYELTVINSANVTYDFTSVNNFWTNNTYTTHPTAGTGSNHTDLGTFYYDNETHDEFIGTGTIYFQTSYLMMNSGSTLTLPTYQGYKITQIIITNTSSCSTAVQVGILSGENNAAAAQTWGTQSGRYTYNISSDYQTEELTVKVTNSKNAQVAGITVVLEEINSNKVATPTFDPAGGVITESTDVTISCETEDATIYYTTDGSTPTTSSAVYSQAITVNSTMTLKAIAVKSGMTDSNVGEAAFTRKYFVNLTQATGGTISVNPAQAEFGQTVTLTAAANVGYAFDSWIVTPSVTLDDNTFAMPANDVTVTATFTASTDARTVSFSINNKVEMTATVFEGGSIDLTKFVAQGDDYTFEGWSTTLGGEIIIPQSSYTPTADITLYPGVAPAPTGDEYTLVTSADQLVAGNLVVITAHGETNLAMSTTQNNNNRGSSSNITKTAQPYTYITITENTTDVCEFTLGGSTGAWTFYDPNKNGYLYAASSSSNYLRTQTENDANGQWAIVVDSNGEATVTAQGQYSHNMLRRNGNLFSCYESGQQSVFIYTKPASKSAKGNRDGVPTTSKVTAIPANVIVTVKEDGIVYLTGSNAGNEANLIVEEGGQLVTSNNVKGTMLKSVTGYTGEKDNYYLISTPLTTNTNPANVLHMINTAGYDLYYFDQNPTVNPETGIGLEWRNYKQSEFNLQPGSGYLYANSESLTLEFAGTNLRAFGTYDKNITYDGTQTFAGWNLVGNPFPCNAAVNMAFYKMNSNNDGIDANIMSADDVIAPMEGVFVLATEGETGQKVTFTATTDAVTTQDSKGITLEVNRENVMLDRAIVGMNEGSMVSKLRLSNGVTELYIPQGDKDYALVGTNGQGELPVNFKASRNATYTISANAENVEMNYLHLIDNMTGADVDLLATPSYTFDARTTDYTSRFRLVFNGNSIDENTTVTETFAFFNGESWSVSNQGEASLQVVDVMGRIVNTQNINGNATINLDETPGIYMLRLVNGNNVKVQKIVVR